MMKPIESELFALIKLVRGWVAQGLKRDEVLARLADPSGVGAQLIDTALARREAGAEYLGRPQVMTPVEPGPESTARPSRKKRR